MSVLINIGLISLLLFCALVNCSLHGQRAFGDIYGDKVDRKLNFTLNPGCPADLCGGNNTGRITVAHITADSKTDRLHNVWSFIGKPSVLIARSSLNSTLRIDWERYARGDKLKCIVIDPEPTDSFVLVVNRIFQFNDVENKGYLNSSALKDKDIATYDTGRFEYVFNKSLSEEKFAQVKVKANRYFVNDSASIDIGSVVYNFHTYGDKEHAWHFPHLLHNSNSSQVDMVLDKFKIKKAFANPRMAVEYVFITTEAPAVNGSNFEIIRRKTLDDEHTPGIFELDTLLTPETFVEYRPVSYSTPERDVSSSTATHLGVLMAPNNTALNDSIAAAYFGNWSNYRASAINISFGMPYGDNYAKTNYTTFTFQMGLGEPPTEELSKFIVIISLVGVGIPVLLLLIGTSCICLKRVRRLSRQNYIPIPQSDHCM